MKWILYLCDQEEVRGPVNASLSHPRDKQKSQPWHLYLGYSLIILCHQSCWMSNHGQKSSSKIIQTNPKLQNSAYFTLYSWSNFSCFNSILVIKTSTPAKSRPVFIPHHGRTKFQIPKHDYPHKLNNLWLYANTSLLNNPHHHTQIPTIQILCVAYGNLN